jgi:TonB family protein
MKTLAALALLAAASISLPAQQCRPPEHPYFEFQVDRPSELIPDSTVSPRPFQPPLGQSEGVTVLVQFVVDTMGRPDTATFSVIRSFDPPLAAAARRAVKRWRYTPALLASCKVPQLVQTPVRP